ncbi:MAG TPA: condensation domain-containing protein, partial [Polyangiaceae bacterium]|nr:condensation domain-containing protein [Polyangiaceae bacterium]
MFTSGSSGRPKGVEISQRALSLHIDDYLTAFQVTDRDAVLQFSTVNFDAALEQMLPILTIGGRLVMRGPELWSWEALNRCLQSERVTLAYLPTGYFRQWLAELPSNAPPSLRLLAVGGEALAGAALAVWRASTLRGVPLENTYGPTEATITTSTHVTSAADVASAIVPIGKSLLGRRAALLSDDGAEVPAGGIGELCIGGASLARGYLGAPALTAERFVPDPRGLAGERLYRTGDRCRRRLDGTFEFLGRRDSQVKLRGYRIELGEVETALRLCPGVTDAVVVLSGEGERARLVGYLAGRASVEAVRDELEQTLPAYMVPAAFVLLDRIPLLPNGKVARNSLPDAPSARKLDTAAAPRTAAEETLLSVWKQVLRREDVGIHDDFFALGGDSILSLQVIARALQAGLRLTPKQLFDHPTVERAALIARFEPAEGEARSQRVSFAIDSEILDATGLTASDIEDTYPATAAQQGLLFHEAFEQTRGIYVYQVRLALQGALDHAAFRRAWEAAVQRHGVLRSSIVWAKRGGATQVVRHSVHLPYFEHDGSALAADYEAWLAKLCADDLARGFDVQQAPLMRVHLVSRSEQAHDLVWTNHHAILDGWSAARLLEEILEDHEAFAVGRASTPRTSLSYGDYVRWILARGDHEAWWRGELGRWNAPAGLEDGIGRARQNQPGTHHFRSQLSAHLAEALRQAAARARVTLHTTFQAAWALVLARYAGRAQALFGSVLSGRPADLPGSDRSVGLFIHTLPMRVDVVSEARVDEWLREVQHQGSELGEHQSTPLGSIQKWAGVAGHSLFDTVLVFENYPIAEILGAGSGRLTIGGIETADRTHYPLTLTVFPRRGRDRGIELEWE